ncbi:uncharacterized protein PHACADRAFT_136030 [Phanerochaete carnosa HHB-10118-sp]|uniref:Uncharacterized protein n=1 Tax=Phanerochaete carnosa (strain HHB-10118-sp) TaxID=650164 RepID=K5W4T1_PHACS|nr:uncharacterized protein PHACADRAFT_136030 [Phanerochaete carnosa HHB-10118-sp]EKM58893.1 hypothetical protein PHACADRAFT_136030 [Phanerochaete carnosa HHB-10118-sp]
MITESDLADWPKISTDNAGRLDDGNVFIGPTESEARLLKLKHFVFADSQDLSKRPLCYDSSVDGQLLAASFEISDVLIWRLCDGLLVQRLQHQGHAYKVNSLSFSPISRTLVSGFDDGSAIVWDIPSGRALLRLEGHSGPVDQVAYAPNGALIAAASGGDKSVKLWDALTGTCIQSFDFDTWGQICKLAFSPDSLRLYVEATMTIFVHDISTCACTMKIQGSLKAHNSFSISRQGDRIAHHGSDGPKKVWIYSTVTGGSDLTLHHPQSLSSPMAFSPDGTEVLVSLHADKTAVTYDSRTGKLRRTFKLSDSGLRCPAYSPDGEYVVIGTWGGNLEVFDAKSGALLAKLKAGGHLTDIQFVPDTQTLLLELKDKPPRLCYIQDIMRMR